MSGLCQFPLRVQALERLFALLQERGIVQRDGGIEGVDSLERISVRADLRRTTTSPKAEDEQRGE